MKKIFEPNLELVTTLIGGIVFNPKSRDDTHNSNLSKTFFALGFLSGITYPPELVAMYKQRHI